MAEFISTMTLEVIDPDTGVVTGRREIDLRNGIILSAAPTTSTTGRVGMSAYVTSGGAITAEFVCTGASGGAYTWVKKVTASGGGGEDSIFLAEYETTPYDEIRAAHNTGKIVILRRGNLQYVLAAAKSGSVIFSNVTGVTVSKITVSSDDVWVESSSTIDTGSGGGGEDSIFIAVYNSTQYSEIREAYDAGKIVFLRQNTSICNLFRAKEGEFAFVRSTQDTNRVTYARQDESGDTQWTYTDTELQHIAYMTTTISDTPSNMKYPSEKAVYDFVSSHTGGGGDSIFVAEYGVTPYSDMRSAYDAGKYIILKKDRHTYTVATVMASSIIFQNVQGVNLRRVTASEGDLWTEDAYTVETTGNRVQSISDTPSNDKYPSEKAVRDFVSSHTGGNGNGINMDEFLQNCTISYGRYENTNYTCIRVFREKIDGTYQYPFVYAPYGDKISDKTPLDVARDGDWTLVINAASGNPSYGVIVQDGTIVKDTVTGQVGAIPLTIDSNGDLGYAAADADLNTLINAGIVSVTTGFGVILADYESVELPTIENISHYWQNVQRQIIGQFPNGDYAIITCEGRGFADSDGWTITQARAFCQNIGLKFAYNLDGGGSTAVIVGKKQLNTIYENETGRLRSTFIVFNGSTKLSVSGGEPSEPSKPVYTITNNLTNVSTSNGTPTVLGNSTYTATLAADGGYSLYDVTVVMGGVDITDAVYNKGVISIAAVTGNVVITATATAVDGYTLCEYLETDGNQHIKTGIKESTLYQVEYKSVNTNWSKAGHTLSGDKIYYPFLRRNTNTSGQCILAKINTENKTIFEDENINESIAHTVKAEIDGSNLISYLDGVEVQTTPIVEVTSTRSLNLFANYSPDTAYNFIGKWYYLKMWTADGSLFRHYRPAVRDTDGVVGVYDMVTDTFYENAGTGAFVVPA